MNTDNVEITELFNRKLKIPLIATVEGDDGGFIAKSHNLLLHGHSDTVDEAIQRLLREIESLYEVLMTGDNSSAEYQSIKEFLKDRIG